MKLVTAIIQPVRLGDVRAALAAFGVRGMTVSEVAGYGRQRGRTQVYRGAESTADLLRKSRLDILADDPDVDDIIRVIARAARTGSVGDGKVWCCGVESVVRIRTGEHGIVAL